MAKPIRILHPTPKHNYVLLPIGLYLNRAIQEGKPNDVIEFWQDWRHDRRVLVRKCKVAVNSSVFTFLAKSIYGEYTRIKDLMAKWEATAICEGVGASGYSKDECLLIEVAEVKED